MILITGGAGYIGSHTVVELINAGYDIIVYDNFSNSSHEAIRRIEQIVRQPIKVVDADIKNKVKLRETFKNYSINAVIHFAGLKAVGESVQKPLKYYDNNISGSICLFEVMSEFECKKIVFSSSATVYGEPKSLPISENFPLSATNPYGRSKLFIEDTLRDIAISDNEWKILLLRYFNPVGAHASALIGEGPNGIPNNLMPFISQVAVGKREYLNIFGDDYDTLDGTGVRDYIHVVDLAQGHLKALQKIDDIQGAIAVNLGTGKGYSVLDMVKAFEKASGKKILYKIVKRRPGDIAACYANPSFAKEFLGWEAKLDLAKMCEDTWRWQSKNPKGYDTIHQA